MKIENFKLVEQFLSGDTYLRGSIFYEWKSYRNLKFLVETMLNHGNEVVNLKIACC